MRRIARCRVRRLQIHRLWTGGWKISAAVGCYLAGILAGALCTAVSPFLTQFAELFLQRLSAGSLWNTAGAFFLSSLLTQALVLFLGFSCLGTPAILAVVAARGCFYGCLCGFLCSTLRLRGVLACAALLWLPQLLQVLLLLQFSLQAMGLSASLYRLVLAAGEQGSGSDVPAKAVPVRCLNSFFLTAGELLLPAMLCGALMRVFGPAFLGGGLF